MAAEFAESVATAKPGVGKIGVQRQRPVVGGGSFIEAPERTKGIAATKPGIGEVGLRSSALS